MHRRYVVVCSLLFAVISCGGDKATYCKEKMSCVGGNDQDEEACIKEIEYVEAASAAYDCSDEADEYLECLYDNSTCHAVGSSNVYWTYDVELNADLCEANDNALESCIARGSTLDD